MEVAAGIWGLSNKDKVQTLYTFSFFFLILFQALTVAFVSQVVNDVTEFYKQTYTNYKDTKQEALKETLRLIHFGVRTQNTLFFFLLLLQLVLFFSALFQIEIITDHITPKEVKLTFKSTVFTVKCCKTPAYSTLRAELFSVFSAICLERDRLTCMKV